MRRTSAVFITLVILILVGAGVFFYVVKYEGEIPQVKLDPTPDILGRKTSIHLTASDRRSGLSEVRVELLQGGTKKILFHERYSTGRGRIEETLEIKPSGRDLRDGEAILRVEARDHSWRRKGNPNVLEAPLTIDTRPPNLGVLSRFHYVYQGGSGLVVYRSSEALTKSGVKVGDLWFPGLPIGDQGYLAFFAIPYDAPIDSPIVLSAEDRAGNQSQTTFNLKLSPRKFRKDTINVSEGFLQKVMPYFTGRDPSLKGEPIDVFIRVNRDLRKSDGKKVWEICRKSNPEPLWSGAFLRMTNAKRMAGFADHRVYLYNGKEVDRQVHMGVDLASLVMSPVEASNRGNVVYADELGIYGNTVILDHGCGLFSMYSHLSRIDVKPGQMMEKAEPLGMTGSTGLAGGDHLHFSMLIFGVYVTPVEWWDPHWVHDNVEIKLALLQGGGG